MSAQQANRSAGGRDGPDNLTDVLIVGAGFAGLYMLIKAREIGASAKVIEAGGDVGGTWYWNRYPGARCDIESLQYSYHFSDELQREWSWTERYAGQPEILSYASHVADRFDLRKDIRFDTRVVSAIFDEETTVWRVETDAGEVFNARFVVAATGCLSAANLPTFKGLDQYAGRQLHTGRWPHEAVSFAGQRVAVIGTGSSGIQAIPRIAEEAAHLTVFQRTPNYVVPAHNRPLDPSEQEAFRANHAANRAQARASFSGMLDGLNFQSALEVSSDERRRTFEARWRRGGLYFLTAYVDLLLSQEANDAAADFVREKISQTVGDPKVAALLQPDYVIGCKRLCFDTNYWATFNRPNVTLVDVASSPIEGFTRDSIRVGGEEYKADAVVFATGFDAVTGALSKIDIQGRAGLSLNQKWSEGPVSYLGLGVAGFPNFFTITGPGSPSVLTNMLHAIEQHVEWIADLIAYMRANGVAAAEPMAAAEAAWVAHNREVSGQTLRATCDSWYVGSNVPGKPHVYLPYAGGFGPYLDKCDAIAAEHYRGFQMT